MRNECERGKRECKPVPKRRCGPSECHASAFAPGYLCQPIDPCLSVLSCAQQANRDFSSDCVLNEPVCVHDSKVRTEQRVDHSADNRGLAAELTYTDTKIVRES